jgi:formaldehyde-activating enzyme involved in methanogenesis
MYNSLQDAVRALGEAKVLAWVNQMESNKTYRKEYNATKQEINKAVRRDPRFIELLRAAKRAASPKSADAKKVG